MAPSRSQSTIVKQLEDFRRVLPPEEAEALGEVLAKVEANADAVEYLEPASSRLGMDYSLYIEAELERRVIQKKID